MFKPNTKFILLSSIIFFQILSSAFSMNNEDPEGDFLKQNPINIKFEKKENKKLIISPKTSSDDLLYLTLLIKTNKGTGTGFIYSFLDKGDKFPVLITNKHVFNDCNTIEFDLHTSTYNNKKLLPTIVNVKLSGIHKKLHLALHKNDIDLCALPLRGIFEKFEEKNDDKDQIIYYRSVTEDIMKDKDSTENLSAVEDILMVGYPKGIYDVKNNFPIFRKGITSSHPRVDYNDRPEFLIDASCVAGSSGSPVFLYKLIEGCIDSTSLLGVLYSGPANPTKGNIINQNNVDQNNIVITDVPINIGYVIKEKVIKTLKNTSIFLTNESIYNFSFEQPKENEYFLLMSEKKVLLNEDKIIVENEDTESSVQENKKPYDQEIKREELNKHENDFIEIANNENKDNEN